MREQVGTCGKASDGGDQTDPRWRSFDGRRGDRRIQPKGLFASV